MCALVAGLWLGAAPALGAPPGGGSSLSDWLSEDRPWDKPEADLVGDAGDLDHLEFTGNQSFTADALRQGLMESPGYLLGSHQLAPRKAFLVLVQQKLLSGYQFSGFPEPQVAVSYEESARRVKVRIVEGRRFLCGKVKTLGVDAPLSQALVERLSQAPIPAVDQDKVIGPQAGAAKKKPAAKGVTVQAEAKLTPSAHPLNPQRKADEDAFLWEPGTPAAFAPTTLSGLADRAKEVLAEHGFFFPKVKVHPERVLATGLADLVVEVSELGPPGELSALEISGNRANSEADLREFLGLKPGMRVTRATLEAAQAKLWESGRFRFCQFTPQADTNAGAAPQHLRLQLKVVEFDFAPKLTQALPERAQALLRLGAWLTEFAARPDQDAVVSLQCHDPHLALDLDFELTLSPLRGLLLQFKDADFATHGYSYSCLLRTNEVGLFAPRRASQLRVVNTNLAMEAFIHAVPLPPDAEQRFNLSAGAYLHSVRAGQEGKYPPFRLGLTLAPAVFLALALEATNCTWHLEGDTCSLVTSNLALRFDPRSGRLGELRYQDESATVGLRFDTNRFEGATRELRRATADFRNEYQESNPLGSFVSFGVGALVSSHFLDRVTTNLTAAERRQAVQAVSRLMDGQVLQPLDPSWGQRSRQVLTNFSVPLEAEEFALAKNSLFALGSGLLFRYGNEWFPKYSWPWTMARESVLMLSGQGAYVDAELSRLLHSDATGPLGCLALAAGLNQMGTPAAKAFAQRGLSRLSTADFRTDCRLLLEGNSGLARTIANMAEVLRTMPPEEVAALVKTLPAPEGQLLRQGAAALRAQPKAPLAVALAPALNTYWEQTLRSRVSARLMELAKRP